MGAGSMSLTMKPLNYILFALLFFLSFSISSISYASAANEEILSVEFNNLSLPDALSKLKDASGVDIVLKRTTDQNRRINKKYDNFTLDDIILDIFRDDNLTASFRYSDNRLTHIGIWMLPKVKGGDNKPVFSYEGRDNRSTVNEIKTDTFVSYSNADTSNYKNTKLNSDSSEDKNFNKNKKTDLNTRVVNNTGSGAYYVNVSEKIKTINNNNYANNEAIIDATNKGTTEIPVPIEIPVATDMPVTPGYEEPLVFEAPPMPPGM